MATAPTWEVVRDNGDTRLCCFCLSSDLRYQRHIIPECKRVWKTGYGEFGQRLGYTGPPICYCTRSKKYPICPTHQMVCGHNIHCPDNIYSNSCHIDGLLPKRTMICNNNLDWEYNFSCQDTCEPTFEIKNGTVHCDNVRDKTICNFSCNDGYEAKRTINLSCAEAKNATCVLSENPTSTSAVWLGPTLGVVGFLFLVVIAIYFIYKKYKTSRPSQHGNDEVAEHLMTENGTIPNGDIPNGVITNGDIPNGVIANGDIPNGVIVQDTHSNPQDRGNQPAEDQDGRHAPEDDDSNHPHEGEDQYPTLVVRDIDYPEGHRSLPYHDSLPCMSLPDNPDSLPFIPGNHDDDDDDRSETPPKSIETESEETVREPLLQTENSLVSTENLTVAVEETGVPSDYYHYPIEETGDLT